MRVGDLFVRNELNVCPTSLLRGSTDLHLFQQPGISLTKGQSGPLEAMSAILTIL
jgi:hypothetical protein